MILPNNLAEHPSPTQVMELATIYAQLLEALFNNPAYIYREPPTAEIFKPSPETNPGLFWTADFAQNTHINCVLPLLPPNASRRCRQLGNPWARADETYVWTATWDAESATMTDTETGQVIEFPRLPTAELKTTREDLVTRGMMTKTLITDNATDPRARALLGGQTFDFGERTRELAKAVFD